MSGSVLVLESTGQLDDYVPRNFEWGGPIGNDVYYTGFINEHPVLIRKVGWGATADYWIEFR